MGRRPKQETALEKETGLEQGDWSSKETGRARTVAEVRGMTPEEFARERGLKAPYHNNLMQQPMGEPQTPVVKDGSGEDVPAENTGNSNMQVFVELSLELANLPEIDLMDVKQVQDRINEYFRIVARYGARPTVVGLGMALNGMDRRRLYEIRTGNYGNTRGICAKLPKNVTVVIKNAYKIMENLWENWMYGIRGNPAAAIFLGKNHFGYEDRTEYVVTPNQGRDSDYDPASIRERLGLTSGDSDSDSDSDSE